MKKIVLTLILLGCGPLWAQDTTAGTPQATHPQFSSNLTEKVLGPTETDLNCGGELTDAAIARNSYLISGMHFDSIRFRKGETVFLAGKGYLVGSRYRLVRQSRNDADDEFYPGQHADEKKLGSIWSDIGVVEIVKLTDEGTVATIVFGCQEAEVGDIVVPYTEPPTLTYTHDPAKFQVWADPTTGVIGRIIEAQYFDFYPGKGHIVYLNLGANRGLKPGDYLRITRAFHSTSDLPAIDRYTERADTTDTTSKDPIKVTPSRAKGMPRHGVGEVMVLSVTPKTATAIITVALDEIHLGDQVEVEP